MAFHHEWAWYNINYPNPDGAICRLSMSEPEWQRMTRWRDFDWFRTGGSEVLRILVGNKPLDQLLEEDQPLPMELPPKNHKPVGRSKNYISPHLLPPAGVPSCSHARRSAIFYYELFYRMLQERECLVRQGLLPPNMPHPLPPRLFYPEAAPPRTCREVNRGREEAAHRCRYAMDMSRRGWSDCSY